MNRRITDNREKWLEKELCRLFKGEQRDIVGQFAFREATKYMGNRKTNIRKLKRG